VPVRHGPRRNSKYVEVVNLRWQRIVLVGRSPRDDLTQRRIKCQKKLCQVLRQSVTIGIAQFATVDDATKREYACQASIARITTTRVIFIRLCQLVSEGLTTIVYEK
jgi:hypothetical protein